MDDRIENLQKISPMQQFLSICAQNLNPKDLMMVLNMIQEVNNEDGDNDNAETVDFIQTIRKMSDELSVMMTDNLQTMAMWLLMAVISMTVRNWKRWDSSIPVSENNNFDNRL